MRMCLRRSRKVGVMVRGNESNGAIVSLMRESITGMEMVSLMMSRRGDDIRRGVLIGFNMAHRLVLRILLRRRSQAVH